MFQKILVFSIHLYPGNLSKVTVLANACSGSLLSPRVAALFRLLFARRAWRICFASRKVLGISFKKIRHGVVNNEKNHRLWYHNSWKKNGILSITCLSVHVSTCLMTFTSKKWRYSGWKTIKWRPRVTFKSSVKGQITLLEVYFFLLIPAS